MQHLLTSSGRLKVGAFFLPSLEALRGPPCSEGSFQITLEIFCLWIFLLFLFTLLCTDLQTVMILPVVHLVLMQILILFPWQQTKFHSVRRGSILSPQKCWSWGLCSFFSVPHSIQDVPPQVLLLHSAPVTLHLLLFPCTHSSSISSCYSFAHKHIQFALIPPIFSFAPAFRLLHCTLRLEPQFQLFHLLVTSFPHHSPFQLFPLFPIIFCLQSLTQSLTCSLFTCIRLEPLQGRFE